MRQQVDALIVGAGISGLAAADALTRAGLRVRVHEARDRVGGRAFSRPVEPGSTRLDLGATWFWSNEPLTRGLVERWGLDVLPQHLTGDALYEAVAGQVQRLAGNPIDTPSFRLREGMQALAERLAQAVPAGTVRLADPVCAVRVSETGVQVRARGGDTFAPHAVIAVPPALAVEHISFEPALPASLRHRAEHTAVWMGGMVKALAVYDAPFWRRAGLAGSAMSHAGPFREFHDHSGAGGTPAAIFGFAPAGGLTGPAGGGPATKGLTPDDLADLFRQQLGRLFGPEGARPIQVHVRDWSREPFTQPQTAPADDPRLLGGGAYERPLHGILHWASTETATSFAGHVEGAVQAGLRAAAAIQAAR